MQNLQEKMVPHLGYKHFPMIQAVISVIVQIKEHGEYTYGMIPALGTVYERHQNQVQMKLKLVIIHSLLLDGQLNLSYTIPRQSIIESYFNEFFDRLHTRCVILNTRPPVLQANQMLVYELTCKSKSITALEGLLGSRSFAQLKKLAPKI